MSAADAPCVRHACRRVRMEMQGEIERLRADARRYQVLRGLRFGEAELAALVKLTGTKFDRAIDAAIQEASHAG